jgi:predicted ATP-dependent protease
MVDRSTFEVSADQLRWHCEPGSLGFDSTDDVIPADVTIGQDRAMRALQLGLELYAPGYNIFVSGLSGSGRATTVKSILETLSPVCARSPERCYVHNFKDPDAPRLLTFPPGFGRLFRKEMEDMLKFLVSNMPKLFEDEQHQKRREKILSEFKQAERDQLSPFEDKMDDEGFQIIQTQMGDMTVPDIFPVIHGEPVPVRALPQLVKEGKLTEDELDKIEEDYEVFSKELQEKLKNARALMKQLQEDLRKLAEQHARNAIRGLFDDLKEHHTDPAVHVYLDEVFDAVIEDLELFASAEEDDEIDLEIPNPGMTGDFFWRYRVNLLHADNSEGVDQCPIIIENHPTYTNLFGTIESEALRGGSQATNFMKIKPGSILHADGGYIILKASDVLTAPSVWPTLKRILQNGTMQIQPPEHHVFGSVTLKPEPIDMNIKVILIGSEYMYSILYEMEEDFDKIFKVKAQFDTEMDRNDANIRSFVSVMRKVIEEEDLCCFDATAISRILEYASREAGQQNKLSTGFSKVADLVREAHFWCRKAEADCVTEAHVRTALKEQAFRNNLPEEKGLEMIEEGSLLITVDGSVVGQVNGLAVLSTGYYDFGKVSRITATVGLGKDGLINIEREVELSGSSHDKGILILGGFLRHLFGGTLPISLTASIAFEQSYGGVDGDSASSTEAYALLSAITGIPIDQGIAVTGSINQFGEIQPIGGVNEKIEGFYATCKTLGLTGRQGVMIPKTNVIDLNLNDEVYEAIRSGSFHIYSIETVAEGLEILTGMSAGSPNADGEFPENSVLGNALDRLHQMIEDLNAFDNPPEDEKDESAASPEKTK